MDFGDSTGVWWRLLLTEENVDAVKRFAGVDLLGSTWREFARLRGNRCVLLDVLWVLVRDKAASLGVARKAFDGRMNDKQLSAAFVALANARRYAEGFRGWEDCSDGFLRPGGARVDN